MADQMAQMAEFEKGRGRLKVSFFFHKVDKIDHSFAIGL